MSKRPAKRKRRPAGRTAARPHGRAEKRAQRLTTLSTLTRLITSATDSDAVFRGIAEAATVLLKAKMAWVLVADPSGEALHEGGSFGLGPEQVAMMRDILPIPRGRGVAGAVLESGRAEYIDDVQQAPRWLNVRLAVSADLHGCAAIPLIQHDRALGVLVAAFGRRDAFSQEEKDIAGLLADQAAIAIESARLLEEADRRRREAEIVADMARTINASLDLDTVLNRVADGARELCGSDVASVWLREPGSDSAVLRCWVGHDYDRATIHRIESGKGAGGLVLSSGQPFRTDDYERDPRITQDYLPKARAVGTIALMVAPIKIGEHVEGLLFVDRRSPRGFTDHDEAVLLRLADQAAIAFGNARLFAESSARRRGAEAVAELGRALLHTLDPKIVGQQTADSARVLLGATNSALYRLDETGALVAIAVSGDLGPSFGENVVFPPGTGAIGAAVRTRQPVTTRDVLADGRLVLTPDLRSRIELAGYRSVLSVPLFLKDRVIGALSVGDRPGRVFDEDEIRSMQTYAAQAALALENARLYAETERRRRETEITAELAQAVNASLDVDIVLQRITDGAKDLVASDIADIALRDGESDVLTIRYRAGAGSRRAGARRIEAGRGIGGRVLLTGQPLRTDDYASDPRFSKDYRDAVETDGVAAVLAVPIKTDERVEGVIFLSNRASRPFTERDEALLVRLADVAAIAIKNAQLYARELESEQRYRSLFENANDPIATFALDGTITSVNPEVTRLLGYSREELIGRQASEFAHPRMAAAIAERARRAMSGEKVPPIIEAVATRKDGSEVIAEGRLSAMRDPQGKVVGWQVIYRDMTERKRAEQALRASEERYRTLIEGSIQGMCILRDWVMLFANTALARMLGYESPRELIGLDARCWIASHELPRIEGYAAARLRGEPAPTRYELQAVRKDGTLIWADVQMSAITWDGEPATQITGLDITERRRAEEALRQQEEQLRQSQKMEAVGRLAGGIAHDFNNLLTVVTGRAELLLRRLPAEDPVRRDVELIKKTAERAAVLTRQLLAFSRKQMLQPRVLDLNQIVTGIAQMLQRLIGEHIELVTALDPDLGRVTADPAQIEQIIVNLAVNARDAMPNGGRLRLETANVELDDAFVAAHPGASTGAHAMLAVSDTGEGMTPEVQAHIFEPFFTTKEVGKGTGLGLATVYGIVKQHEGYIDAESAPGAGTTLRVYLRRVEEPVERTEPGPGHPGLPWASETVLLVEDENDLRALTTEILDGAGYAVLVAGGPSEALERAKRHHGQIHLLLTDVVMPGMSGRDLAERLTPAYPGMKVLYMSGYTADAIVHQGVLDPGTALLQKPFTPEALTRKVREVLTS